MIRSLGQFRHFQNFFHILVGLLLISCREDAQIQSYSAPNHYQGPVVAWKLPEQWGENPGMSGMMAGSFHVKTEQGPRGRIGVMPFRESVETTSIINMFARELGHADYNDTSLKDLIKFKTFSERTFELARLEDKSGKEDPPRTALLAIHRQNEQTWLFPLLPTVT